MTHLRRIVAQGKKKPPSSVGGYDYKRGIDLRSDTLLQIFLGLARASGRLLLGDTVQFALRHEPALATHIGQQSALDHLAAETTEQLLLRFIRS